MNASEKSVPSSICDLVGAAVGPGGDGEVASIEGIDWLVRDGDYWLMAGWAGSGKSDLLGTVAGLQRPLAGRCLVFGKDLHRLDQAGLVDLRLRVGYVFSDGGRLFNELTIAENIALPLAYHTNRGLADVLPELEQLLATMELSAMASFLPGQVGRDWRQRAALARALSGKPGLLLLTNPIAGFDARHGLWWMKFLSRLNAGHPLLGNRPLTIVVATDDLRAWTGHAKQFGMIRDRKLFTYQSRQELGAGDGQLLREWFYDASARTEFIQSPG